MTELVGARADLVRILTKLTGDVERFDSMVLNHRKVLEHFAGHLDELDDDQFRRQAEQIRTEAAQVVACARQALDELSRISKPVQARALQEAHRGRPGGLPKRRGSD
jgi:hypothetical protein